MNNDASPPYVKPFFVSVEKGKRYAWCACGRSKTQPFCDGSHKGTNIVPTVFTAEKTEGVLLCGCKKTKGPPFCDGAHNNLQDAYALASETEIAETKNAKCINRDKGERGKAMLDGGAFVVTPAPLTPIGQNLSEQTLIGAQDGARRLTLLALSVPGASSWRVHGGGDTALFVRAGKGAVMIDGASFDVNPETGVCIRRGEAFRFEPQEEMNVFAAISPSAAPISAPEEPAGRFLKDFPDRCVSVDPKMKKTMADRFYQVLVDSAVGSPEMTQFIGEVPKSRAAFHRHLYEEVIVILSGEGALWTRNTYAPVRPGDAIYLPPRQEHSLECVTEGGMRLMGVFSPAGSPAVNY